MLRIVALLLGVLSLLPRGASAETYAVVVAVSEYPNLPRHRQLVGPKNDATAMISFLRDQQGVQRSLIAVLADQLPESDRAPTKTNIIATLAATASKLNAGDTVWLYFAGHGSQQPQPPGARTPEPDGLDEVFLPQDAAHWDGEIAAIRNAIVDDELGDAIERMRVKGADVIAIFDTCHAADSVRGPNVGETTRAVPPAELGVPRVLRQQLLAPAQKADRMISPTKTPNSGNDAVALKRGHLTALYASAAFESTPELRVPRWSPVGKKRGLFTYHLLEVWSAQPNESPSKVIEKVRERYRAMGRRSPTPSMESDQP